MMAPAASRADYARARPADRNFDGLMDFCREREDLLGFAAGLVSAADKKQKPEA